MVIGKVDSAESSPQPSAPPSMSGLTISAGESDDPTFGMLTKLQNELDCTQEEVRQLRAKLNEQAQIKEMNTLMTGTDEEVQSNLTLV